MLLGISPLLSAELLTVLDRMGHSDPIAIVDANFPAHRLGPRVIELVGAGAPDALAAILGVMPLDPEAPVELMAQANDDEPAPVQLELLAAIREAGGPIDSAEYVERFAFYERAAAARAIVRTGEVRAYGNAIVCKGVVTGATS